MTIIARLLADPAVAEVFEALDGKGEDIRIAGGAVRDALDGNMPAEIDFATTALPDEVIQRATQAGLKTVPTGIEHGTVTLIVRGKPFEVTTLRRDVTTDGRHALVAFGRDWDEDARRRDFTINGLFLDRVGGVYDAVGGRADLAARRVRFIGDARTRVREDYLRILRFFRFFARYGDGGPDGGALSAIIAERHGIRHLSRERIRAELLKLLCASRAGEVAATMSEIGLLGLVLAGIARVRRLGALIEIETALGREPDELLRLGALALFIEDDAARLRERLRLSNAETVRLATAAGRPVPTPEMSEADRKAALYRLGAQVFQDRVLLAWAHSGHSPRDPNWQDVFGLPERWTAPKCPLTASSFMALGVKQGPALGTALSRAEALWIAEGFPEDSATLDAIACRAVQPPD